VSTASALSNLEHLQHAAFGPLNRRFAWVRLLVGPLVLVSIAAPLFGEPAPWRKVAAAICLLGGAIGSVWEYRYVKRQDNPLMTPKRLVLKFILIAVYVAVTGGFESPMVPIIVPFAYAVSMLTSRRSAAAVAAVGLALLWALAVMTTKGLVPDLVPSVFGGGSRAGHNDALIYSTAAVSSLMLGWAVWLGSLFRTALSAMIQTALAARDEALAGHAEYTRTLTALSGEIAHELKNPLASVKGLAALVSKDLEGKPAERMAVLRREVDRMQEILDSFLNFSRPLLPLNGGRVSLRALCEQVAALHEGIARERAVSLVITGEPPVQAWCDPRKVKQVLINLVQNALDASPQGSIIELRIFGTAGGEARVSVCDRGAGLPEAVRDRAFEPGVTTKATGSGLGLAIARGLARQHGGELLLQPREGGGSVAELTLPGDGPPPAAPVKVAA
jgi:two-component system, NtrC family, sensor histidine kinase HydH